jgi:hypothetical protein
MLKHYKGRKRFLKYMDKKLPHFYVYGYYKIIVHVSKNNNTLLAHL